MGLNLYRKCFSLAQDAAFQKVKDLLTSQPVLALYDPKKETIVSADASSFGLLGAVLLHIQPDNILRLVAYSLRVMSETERRYAQIEKKALASTWACERFKDYLLGMKFHIHTDHKPLVPLLSCKDLSDLPARIQRFRIRLMRFSYTIEHIPGKQMYTADVLSRSPCENPSSVDTDLSEEASQFLCTII